eukprot:4824671-Pleurochrysis_carterae.AAC.2
MVVPETVFVLARTLVLLVCHDMSVLCSKLSLACKLPCCHVLALEQVHGLFRAYVLSWECVQVRPYRLRACVRVCVCVCECVCLSVRACACHLLELELNVIYVLRYKAKVLATVSSARNARDSDKRTETSTVHTRDAQDFSNSPPKCEDSRKETLKQRAIL